MKTYWNELNCLAKVMALLFAIIMIVTIVGCVSLEERLASQDRNVRYAAEVELWNSANTMEECLSAIKRIGDEDLLYTIAMNNNGPHALAAYEKFKESYWDSTGKYDIDCAIGKFGNIYNRAKSAEVQAAAKSYVESLAKVRAERDRKNEERRKQMQEQAEQARRQEEESRRDAYWKAFDEEEYKSAIRNYDKVSGAYYKDWLREWIGPRIPKKEEEIAQGDAALEDFGTEFLPNAYRQYEEALRTAQEIQRVFNENFPEPSKIRRSDPRWNAFDKMVKGLSKARTEYFRQRDQLCHFYLLHWTKSISAEELKKVDAAKISIRLMEALPRWEGASVTNKYDLIYALQRQVKLESLSQSCVEFAKEHMPKTFAQRQNLIDRFKRCDSDYFAIRQQCCQIDCCRIELPVVAITEELLFVTMMLNENFNDITVLQAEFVTLEKDAKTVTRIDGEKAERLRRFDEILKGWVQDRCNGPLIAVNSAMSEFFPCDYLHPWHLVASGGEKVSYSDIRWCKYDLFARIRGRGEMCFSISTAAVESALADIDNKVKYKIYFVKDGTGHCRVRLDK